MATQNVLNLLYVICIMWTIHACCGVSTKKENESLKNQMELLMNKVEMVVEENANLVKENGDLRSEFKMVVKENADLRSEFKMVVKENADLRKEFKMVAKENADLRKRVDALEQRNLDHLPKKGRRQSAGQLVAFSAYLDHRLTGLGLGQSIAYNRALTNEGHGYNTASGVFAAPVSGLYLFSWASTARRLPGGAAYDMWVNLVVDGVQMMSTVAESREETDDNQGSSTVVLWLNQGQQVWTSINSNNAQIHGDGVERSTSFTGVLIH